MGKYEFTVVDQSDVSRRVKEANELSESIPSISISRNPANRQTDCLVFLCWAVPEPPVKYPRFPASLRTKWRAVPGDLRVARRSGKC